MTNKINLVLVIFMAMLLSACNADEPTVSIGGTPGGLPPPPTGDNDGFKEALTDERTDVKDGWGSGSGVDHPRAVTALENSFLVTQIGTASDTEFIVLGIRSIGTGNGFNDGTSHIGVGVSPDLNTAIVDAAKTNNFDPRKLLFSVPNEGLRMAWAGRIADPASNPSAGLIVPFGQFLDYDEIYSAALTATLSGSTYSIPPDANWQIHGYNTNASGQNLGPKVGSTDITTFVKSSTSQGKTRAWFWLLPVRNGTGEHFAYLPTTSSLGFGTHSSTSANNFEPNKGSGGYSKDLNTAKETVTHNNLNPPGKMLFGRKTGDTPSSTYLGNTAIIMATVVGYNIRTRATRVSNIERLGDDVDARFDVSTFYMEFDADVQEDAVADGYNNTFNFPDWGNGANDGPSISGGAKVTKFTGLLLKEK